MRLRSRLGWVLILATAITLAAQSAAPPARADDLQQQLEQAQKDLDAIRQRQQEVRNALADVSFQAEAAEAQLRMVDGEMTEANGKIAEVDGQLTAATTELKQVQVDLTRAQQEFDVKKEVMGARMRAIRENGRVDYLSVLLGAASFRDFVGRLDVLSMVVNKDRELFETVQAQKVALEQKQQEVTERQNRLATLKAEAENYRNTVASKRVEREEVSRSLQQSRSSLQYQLDQYDQHTENLSQQVAAIVRQMNRKGGTFAPIPPVSPILITDPYGMREHPILGGQRMHWGVDLNAYSGQPVYAIEDGVVISASYDDAFGNLIIVDHGGGITSWYAHNSSFLVGVNETVTQGQQIAAAGSTGWSTGAHVHLEIHINGERVDPMGYIGQ